VPRMLRAVELVAAGAMEEGHERSSRLGPSPDSPRRPRGNAQETDAGRVGAVMHVL